MSTPAHIAPSLLSAQLPTAVALLALESSFVAAKEDLVGAEATADAVLADGANSADDDVLTSEAVPPEEGFVERAARAFNESDLVFARSFSNAPFLPVAFLGNTHYGDAMVSEEGATPETAGTRYRVNSTSQYGGIPFLLNKRSMAVLGEYISYSNFTVDNGEDFSVASASLAAGYLYQVNPDWQVIGALVPFYNHSSLGARGKDYWQVMGWCRGALHPQRPVVVAVRCGI